MSKLPKGSVNYRMIGEDPPRCGTCMYYIPEYGDIDGDQDDATGCELVAGSIEADGWCDLWVKVDTNAPKAEPGAWRPPSQSTIAPLDMATLYPASGPSRSMSVNKSDDEGFRIAKIDESESLVFGWASIAANADGGLVTDHHDDIIEPDELEKAAYEYVLKFRDAGEMHKGESVGQLVESLVMTPDKARAMGIQTPMHTGWWVGYKLSNPDVFAKVKSGDYSMFSIQGTAVREDWDGEEE